MRVLLFGCGQKRLYPVLGERVLASGRVSGWAVHRAQRDASEGLPVLETVSATGSVTLGVATLLANSGTP